MIKILNYCVKYSAIHYIIYYKEVRSLRIYLYDNTDIVLSNICEKTFNDICKCLISYKEV